MGAKPSGQQRTLHFENTSPIGVIGISDEVVGRLKDGFGGGFSVYEKSSTAPEQREDPKPTTQLQGTNMAHSTIRLPSRLDEVLPTSSIASKNHYNIKGYPIRKDITDERKHDADSTKENEDCCSRNAPSSYPNPYPPIKDSIKIEPKVFEKGKEEHNKDGVERDNSTNENAYKCKDLLRDDSDSNLSSGRTVTTTRIENLNVSNVPQPELGFSNILSKEAKDAIVKGYCEGKDSVEQTCHLKLKNIDLSKCAELKVNLISCYSANVGQPLNCSEQASAFTSCVNDIVKNHSPPPQVPATEPSSEPDESTPSPSEPEESAPPAESEEVPAPQ